ncbi:MAG: 3-oxoacid CoA-transferase subunit A [Alistipes sp.]
MSKKIDIHNAVALVKDGMTVMVGGFLGVGAATEILSALAKTNVRNLTLICNDTAFPDKAQGLLVAGGHVSKLIVTHIGTNPITGEKMNSGEIKVEFVPQGTLAERIRAAGAGLGGVLTQTGLGTIVAEGKPVITVDGVDYLLEKPLHADLALLGASVADESGNLIYRGTSQNFNPLMATAADVVIVEAQKVVPCGELVPETVHTPGIFINYIYTKQN